MSSRVPCTSCETEILEITAKMNNGLCHPCLKGSFNCELCNKRVLITEGVNDNDKICLGCWDKNRETAVKDGLITIKEREHKDEDIVVVHFPNKVKYPDKVSEYKAALEKLLEVQSPIIELDEKKFFDSIIIRRVDNYWYCLGLVRGAAETIFINENISVEGVMSENNMKLFIEKQHPQLIINKETEIKKKKLTIFPVIVLAILIIDIILNIMKL